MNKKMKKIVVVLLALIVIMSVFTYYAFEKSGMFIDEIYSYGLSNGDHTPFLIDVKDGDLVDKVFTNEEFTDYVTVDGDDGFDPGSVYYNQTKDVHPPVYYFLLNGISSVVPGTFTKWTGLLLNFVIYLITLVLLYKISMKLFDCTTVSVSVVLLYGLSTMGLSTALMIRMYCLLTCLTLVLLYLLLSYDEKKRWYTAVLIGLTIFVGLLTHYYFVIYAFFLCLAFFIKFIKQREYKACAMFSISAVAGAGLMVAVFPAVIDHLFADKLVSGGTAYSNITDPLGYPKRIAKYGLDIICQMPLAVLAGVILLVAVILLSRKNKSAVRKHFAESRILEIAIPVFVSFVAAAIVSPIHSERYIYNITPVFVLIVGYLMCAVKDFVKKDGALRRIGKYAAFAVLAVAVCVAVILQPDYIYNEHTAYNEAVAEYKDIPCVYFSDNYGVPMTQDLVQLMEFDEVFVTDSPDSAALAEYLSENDNPETVVVYVDVSEFWSSGFDSEEMLHGFMESGGYSSCEPLYKYGLSEAYVLNK